MGKQFDSFLTFSELPKKSKEKAVIEYINGYEKEDGDRELEASQVYIMLTKLKEDRYLIDGTFSHEVQCA